MRRGRRCTVPEVRIASIRFEPWNVELTEPFGIATGAQLVAENVLVEVELTDGSCGLGEAAPFPAVNAETQADALLALSSAVPQLEGYDAAGLELPGEVLGALGRAPSALAALEVALLDADCRSRGTSMFQHFGGQQSRLLTDPVVRCRRHPLNSQHGGHAGHRRHGRGRRT